MQPLTIITTYYNEKIFLEEFVRDFKQHKSIYPDLKLLIVDDGSQTNPAKDIVVQEPDIQLFTVLEDLGFNSHGARNLGVEVTKTEWNLLIDVDYDISSIDFSTIFNTQFDNDTIYFLDNNAFIIHKDVFMSCYGYDEEYVNIHHGDRIFLSYLKSKFNYTNIIEKAPRNKRNKRKSINSDTVLITTYTDKILYNPSFNNERKPIIQKLVEDRYASEDFDNKPILNFRWEKTF